MRYKLIIISLIVIFAIFSQSVDALCKDNQIDINSATKEELDELYGIGPVKAQAIMDSRSFSSIDDLIEVKGIGEITLEKIKEQGLACVDEKDKIEDEENSEETAIDKNKETNNLFEENEQDKVEKQDEISVIKLTPQTIKTEENNENSDRNYAVIGFVIFCVLLVFLFALRKNKFKNEFDG